MGRQLDWLLILAWHLGEDPVETAIRLGNALQLSGVWLGPSQSLPYQLLVMRTLLLKWKPAGGLKSQNQSLVPPTHHEGRMFWTLFAASGYDRYLVA